MRDRRGLATIAAALLLLLAATHTGLWFWAVSTLDQQVAANLAQGLPPGWRAEAGITERGGWPLRAELRVPRLVLRQEGGIVWTAGWMVAEVGLLRPLLLVVSLEGPQSVQLAPAAPVPVTADRMRAEVPLAPRSGVRSLVAEVAGLRAELPGGALTLGRVDLQLENRPAAQRDEPALTLALTLSQLVLPPTQSWPLGPEVAQLALDAVVAGPVPRFAELQDRALAWRDGGGALVVRRLELRWGEVWLSSSATLALDAQLQPAGAATARVAGHGALLDALVGTGALTARAAGPARAVLGLMARSAADTGVPVVEVPFTLQNRTLALGRIPLVRFPELSWRPPP